MKKQTKPKNKKSDNAKLAAGAAKMHKLESEAKKGKSAKGKRAKKKTEVLAPVEPVVIPESTRDIKDILADHVTVLDGSVGVKLSDDIPLEESLRVLDWTTALSDHVGFMIGDVLNFGNTKWGEKYKAALNQTGRAKTTLKHYAWVARTIPPEKRVASLTYSHHEEIARLGDRVDVHTVDEVLNDAQAQAKKGKAPTVKELRIKVTKLTPRKVKKPKKVTSGKGKKARKPVDEPPPYEPTPDQQLVLDELEENLGAINDTLTHLVDLPSVEVGSKRTVLHLICYLDNPEKRRWLDTLLQPLVDAYNTIERCTGYES